MEEKKFEKLNDKELDKVSGGTWEEDVENWDWPDDVGSCDPEDFEYKVGQEIRFTTRHSGGEWRGIIVGYSKGEYVVNLTYGQQGVYLVAPSMVYGLA